MLLVSNWAFNTRQFGISHSKWVDSSYTVQDDLGKPSCTELCAMSLHLVLPCHNITDSYFKATLIVTESIASNGIFSLGASHMSCENH